MARQLRFDVPNIMYHVINRGNARQRVFRSLKDRQEYLELIKRYKDKYGIRLYHFVLMANHVHFLLEPTEEGALSAFMHDVTLAHTMRFNRRQKTVGHVWQGRYKSIPIESDAYFLQCGRYIELNPVRAKLVDHPAKYPWSSYAVYAIGAESDVVDVHPLYHALGKTRVLRERRYIRDMESALVSTHESKAMRFGDQQIYGRDAFIDKVKTQGFLLLRDRPGRPKRDFVCQEKKCT